MKGIVFLLIIFGFCLVVLVWHTHVQAVPSSPIATVNGEAVTLLQFQTWRQTQHSNEDELFHQPDGQSALRDLIMRRLILQLARREGVAPTNAEVKSVYHGMQMSTEVEKVKSLDQSLRETGLTVQDEKDWVIQPLIAQAKLIAQGQPIATAQEIKAEYTRNKDRLYTMPHSVHVKRIVLKSHDMAALDYKRIQHGQPFEQFFSQPTDADFPSGDVPKWINLDESERSYDVPSPLLATVQQAKPGSVLPPYAFQYNPFAPEPDQSHPPFPVDYWIIKVVEFRPRRIIPLKQARDMMLSQLYFTKSVYGAAYYGSAHLQIYEAKLLDFQRKSHIKIYDSQYAGLTDELTRPNSPLTGIQ